MRSGARATTAWSTWSMIEHRRGPRRAAPNAPRVYAIGAGLPLAIVVLGLGRLRHALAEGVALVLVRAVLLGKRLGADLLALGGARLGRRLALGDLLAVLGVGRGLELLRLGRHALAVRVGALLALAVLGGESLGAELLGLGLALLGGVGVCRLALLLLITGALRHALAEGVALVGIGAVLGGERLAGGIARAALGATLLGGVLAVGLVGLGAGARGDGEQQQCHTCRCQSTHGGTS